MRISSAVERVLAAGRVETPPEIPARLTAYFELLMEWNRRVNLTGFHDGAAAVEKHLGDTITLLPHLPAEPFPLLDIGTGPGVPGLLLAVLRPDIEVWACDAVRKKVSFVLFCAARLELKNLKVLHQRLDPRVESSSLPSCFFKVVVSQAMTSAGGLARLAAPYLAHDGYIIAMKGSYPEGDRERDSVVFNKLGVSARVIPTYHPTTGGERCLVVITRS